MNVKDARGYILNVGDDVAFNHPCGFKHREMFTGTIISFGKYVTVELPNGIKVDKLNSSLFKLHKCTDLCKSSTKELATQILGQFELYGNFYYKLEDWLTECLEGNVQDLPRGIEGEYLRCALRLEVRDFFNNKDVEDIESDDIEECVDRIVNHFSRNVLDIDFISDIVDEYIKERKEN